MAKHAHTPAEYSAADVAAIRALHEGVANEGQQRRAMEWIIRNACGMYDLSYRPGGQDGDRATAFAEGRRFAGLQIAKMLTPEVLKAVSRGDAASSDSKTRQE
ncbi:hypothetical protein [Pelagibacterium luteolum]|uniref:Uncharacterized protein n=1 Tax=Pelagibacterium luteolum TaxID=440168 RepID=A0A1G7ZHV2_9HYPH|nr:hypothetical protein [Pelagibacterium luteolum]SDH08351.1 hypothetical protein SAMN04487974_12031 [Pelagibacterium luteolum]